MIGPVLKIVENGTYKLEVKNRQFFNWLPSRVCKFRRTREREIIMNRHICEAAAARILCGAETNTPNFAAEKVNEAEKHLNN